MTLIFSGLVTVFVIPMADSLQQANEYTGELMKPDAKERERIYLARLAQL